ncbi:MAG TPA: hypothetical protein VFP43_12935, partial [Mesorhizobium sp.]|nr:hypothetical protein [Mesorhizobium sp.]
RRARRKVRRTNDVYTVIRVVAEWLLSALPCREQRLPGLVNLLRTTAAIAFGSTGKSDPF